MGHGGGGFVYILDMGAPLKILRLAEEMIKLSPRSSEEKIPITFIGVRPGEKLEERLLADDEVMEPTSNKEIGKVALSNGGGMFLDEFVSKMRPLVDEGDDDGARQLLMGFCKRKKEDE